MPQKLVSFFLKEWISIHSAWKAIFDVFSFITCGAKLQNADWLRQRAFFLDHEGTFGNLQGMLTWCWLERSVIADEIIFTTMASRFVEADGTLISFRECNSHKNFALYVIKK